MNEELIKQIKGGDTEKLGEILMENMDLMYRIAFGILKNDDHISDAVSNTIVIVFEKISSLKNAEFFKTWLIRILINECYKIFNQNKKIIYLENYNQDSQAKNDDYSDFETRELIKSLSSDLQEIVILYYFENFNVKEIANIVKIPEGTVKSRLSRARKELSGKLRKEVI